MVHFNTVPYCNRATRRKVEKYMRSHRRLTFTQAYNAVFSTSYEEPIDLSCDMFAEPEEIANDTSANGNW